MTRSNDRNGLIARNRWAAIFVAVLCAGCGGSSFLNPVLKLKGVDPALGPSDGGTTIRLVGAGFVAGSTVVTIAGETVAAENVEFVSPVELRVVLPPLPAAASLGRVDIVVTNPAAETDPEETAALRGMFRYFASTVDFDVFRNVVTPPAPRSGIITDLDRNSVDDLVIAHRSASVGLSRYLGTGNGSFQPRPETFILRGARPDPLRPSTDALEPNRIVSFDVDGDIFPDFATTARFRNRLEGRDGPEVFLLRGSGTGDLEFARSFGAGDVPSLGLDPDVPSDTPSGLVRADFDRDGELDLAVAYLDTDNVFVFFGDGDGGFDRALAPLPVGRRPVDLLATDLNGDGPLDLAVANFLDGTVSVYFGGPGGSFRPAANSPSPNGAFPSNGFPIDLASGSFSAEDSIPDLVAVNSRSGTVSILEGDGFAGYEEPRSYLTGDQPSSVVVADLDGNGLDDIAVAATGEDTCTLFLQVAAAEFATESILTGRGPETILTARLFDDAVTLPDLVTINPEGDNFTVHRNLGEGFFDQPVRLGRSTDPDSIERNVTFTTPENGVVHDFDLDGIADLVVTDSGREEILFLPGLPDGDLDESRFVASPFVGRVADVAAGDLDGDGLFMLARAPSATLFPSTPLCRGAGFATAAAATGRERVLVPFADRVVVADLDDDGRDEALVTSTRFPIGIRVLEIGADGEAVVRSTVPVPRAPDEFSLADLDGDAFLDLVLLVDEPGLVSTYRGSEAGFTPVANLALAAAEPRIAIGDWDGDELDDIAVADAGSAVITLHTTDPRMPGTFLESFAVQTPTAPQSLVALEVNGDLRSDLIAVDGQRRQAFVLVNASDPAGTPRVRFEEPLNIGLGPDPTEILVYRPGASEDALPDLVVLGATDTSVLVLRNISF